MFFNNYKVINNIYSKLLTKQKELFGSTSFGPFLNLPEYKYQSQLFHHFFMRELNQPNPEVLWFQIGIKRRWFSIAEFALITGLRCVSDLDKNMFKTSNDSFMDLYFKDYEKLTKVDLETVFLLSQFKSDEDTVNMVALYFINNYLSSRTRESELVMLMYRCMPVVLLMNIHGDDLYLIGLFTSFKVN